MTVNPVSKVFGGTPPLLFKWGTTFHPNVKVMGSFVV